MMLSGSEEVFEVARWLFMALLTAQWAGSVESVQQFTIHRMQHIDIGSTSFGARLHHRPRRHLGLCLHAASRLQGAVPNMLT